MESEGPRFSFLAMTAACPFCGTKVRLASDAGEHRSTGQKIPAQRHWLECPDLECKAKGPARPTREGASLAFIHRAAYLRPASAEPAPDLLAGDLAE